MREREATRDSGDDRLPYTYNRAMREGLAPAAVQELNGLYQSYLRLLPAIALEKRDVKRRAARATASTVATGLGVAAAALAPTSVAPIGVVLGWRRPASA